MHTEFADTVVVGAGVIGLAVAQALARAGREVLVLEANAGIGQETSSRNSEVIHAGIYYPPGSLKAKTCVQGNSLLYRYCKSRNIPCRRVGKLIVATGESQLTGLEWIKNNAARSGADPLQPISREQLRKLEPAVEGLAALLSPATGIVDSHALMLSLLADFEAAGGTLVTRCRVAGGEVTADGIRLRIASGDQPENDEITTRLLINAAGLGATALAENIKGLPSGSIPQTYFVKGQYFTYSKPSPFSRLVYPLPDEHGLGIHATLDRAGQLRFGPDARYTHHVDYSFDEERKALFADAIRRWFPALREDCLQEGYVGVRPRLTAPGQALQDFVVSGTADHGVPGYTGLYGIESPGLTASLAIAALLAESVSR